MSNETIVQNGAPGATDNTKNDAGRPSVGKIARLPKDVREELNCRLDNGQPASDILPWVNELPMVKEVLAKHFGGVPINEVNLSMWRRGGYKRWVEKQESEAEIRILAEDMKDVLDAGGGTLARGTASIVAAKILKMVQTMPAGQESIDALMKISYAVSALMNAEQGQARLEFEKKRVELRDEEVTLKWDKQQRDGVAIAQRALDDALAKDIQASNIDNGEKIELLGYRLYGGKWQGRKVGKKEEAKEPERDGPIERAEPEKTDVQTADQQVRPTVTLGNSTEEKVSATGAKVEELKISGGLPTAATVSPASPKQKSSAPKSQEQPLSPKPSPWDAFSEPVTAPGFAYRPEPLRPAPGFNTLG